MSGSAFVGASLARAIGWPSAVVQVADELPSTHVALTGADLDERPHVLLAHAQTAGRGRGDRLWLSAPGDSIALSVRAVRAEPIHALAGLSVALGVCAWSSLRQLGADSALKLKWPNDLVVGDAKLAGILVDVRAVGPQTVVIASIGVNVDRAAALAVDRAITDLRTAFPAASWSVLTVAAALARDWIETLSSADWRDWLARFDAADALRGQRVTPRGASAAGIARGIDARGWLKIETDAGIVAAHRLEEIE
jgi:BirA family transcriptional regulator, biotin operon repressor / biotin---[acetyl-CoA-carboxylase] ligase